MPTRKMATLALVAALLALVLVSLLLIDREPPGTQPASPSTAAPPPLSTWFVDQDSEPWRFYQTDQSLAPIATRPRFAWFGPFTTPDRLRIYVDRATAAGKVPLIALFNVEARECRDLKTAARFYRQTAAAINSRTAIVAFEPDSLGTMEPSQDACFAAIRSGLAIFAALPNAWVFMEAGASDWEGATRMAKKLKRVRVCRADGILLNATHADWNHRNIRYGHELDKLITGCRLRILVNTAENGRGPNPRTQPRHWCDYRQRYGLGWPPTNPTHHSRVLYGWVNRPGFTQKCYDPPVRFAPYRARNLIERASLRESP